MTDDVVRHLKVVGPEESDTESKEAAISCLQAAIDLIKSGEIDANTVLVTLVGQKDHATYFTHQSDLLTLLGANDMARDRIRQEIKEGSREL